MARSPSFPASRPEPPRPPQPIVELPSAPRATLEHERWVYDGCKRLLDIGLGLLLLLLGLPALAIAALLVRMSSPGPVIFRQVRSGKDGRTFACYKFRTMVDGAESRQAEIAHLNETGGPAFKVQDDPRATRVGRWLRKTSIDELPQVINVLKGEMSIVGPRPLPVHETDQLSVYHRQRLSVIPGLTCIWQVSGRSSLSFDEWMAMDLEYIRRRGFLLDLSLVVRTIPALITRRGAV